MNTKERKKEEYVGFLEKEKRRTKRVFLSLFLSRSSVSSPAVQALCLCVEGKDSRTEKMVARHLVKRKKERGEERMKRGKENFVVFFSLPSRKRAGITTDPIVPEEPKRQRQKGRKEDDEGVAR